MFILVRGEVHMLDADGETLLLKVPEGGVFGEGTVLRHMEVGGLCAAAPSPAPALASNCCCHAITGFQSSSRRHAICMALLREGGARAPRKCRPTKSLPGNPARQALGQCVVRNAVHSAADSSGDWRSSYGVNAMLGASNAMLPNHSTALSPVRRRMRERLTAHTNQRRT